MADSLLLLAILAAVLLDLLVAEVPDSVHPVRLLGSYISLVEKLTRRLFGRGSLEYAGGLALLLMVAGAAYGVAWIQLSLATTLSPTLGFAVAVGLIYFSISQCQLGQVAASVGQSLRKGDLNGARRRLAALVGRDTDELTDQEVLRGGLESVAENTNDGFVAPLLYAFVLGPAGAVLFRAINTADSMVGYKNEAYHRFGWASARVDDLLGFIPARLTGLCFVLAAATKKTAWRALSIMLRQARRHPSPNAGFPEAAMAGALGVRLGGINYYGGQPSLSPHLGPDIHRLEPALLEDGVRLTRLGAAIFVAILVGFFSFFQFLIILAR